MPQKPMTQRFLTVPALSLSCSVRYLFGAPR
jgi:hypothetical protein